MNIETKVCKLILERLFPSAVCMTVEDNSALNFACRLFETCNIVTCFLFEELINNLLVKTELKNAKNKTESDKND